MRVLVAGGTGFLGKAITRRLDQEGVEIRVAGRSTGVDLRDADAVDRLPACEVVVHVAGSGSVVAPGDDPAAERDAHLTITGHLLEHARRCGARVVAASTFVYGTAAGVPAAEDDPVAPHSDYTMTRWRAEESCRAFHHAHCVPVDVLRVFNAYGPHQPASFVIPSIVAGAIAGRIALADPAPRRDFVHVDDVARAFALAARRREPGFTVVNIGSGESRSIGSIAREAARLAGGDVEIAWSGRVRAAEVPDARADIARAARVLDWRPAIRFDDGLAALIATARASSAGRDAR